MQLLAAIVFALLVGCQPFANALVPPAPLPTPTPFNPSLRLTVVNSYPLHYVDVDVNQSHCNGTNANGPLQPYGVPMRAAQTTVPPTLLITGRPMHCLTTPRAVNSEPITVVFNENWYFATCGIAIVPKGHGYAFAFYGARGPQTRCRLDVTSPRSAIFTFSFHMRPVVSPYRTLQVRL